MREEISANRNCYCTMSFGKCRGPKIINGKPPDWMVVVEVDPHTKIEQSNPGLRCGQKKQEIAAQLADWGAMALNTASQYIGSLPKGNRNETIFFMKGRKAGKTKGRVLAEGRLWKVSILPTQPPGIKCINEDMASEMAQVRRDYQNNQNR